MTDERVVEETVSKFLLGICRLRPQLSRPAVKAAWRCAVISVSVKRRHSVFDAQNFGQNAQKRKTVRQVTQRIFR